LELVVIINEEQDSELAEAVADGILQDLNGRTGFLDAVKATNWRTRRKMLSAWKRIVVAAIQWQRRCRAKEQPTG
jgi:hypothetical protein